MNSIVNRGVVMDGVILADSAESHQEREVARLVEDQGISLVRRADVYWLASYNGERVTIPDYTLGELAQELPAILAAFECFWCSLLDRRTDGDYENVAHMKQCDGCRFDDEETS